MRTTLNLDEDVYVAAEMMAKASGKTLGKVVSELIRTGLRPQSRLQPASTEIDSLPSFAIKPGTPLISLKILREHWEED